MGENGPIEKDLEQKRCCENAEREDGPSIQEKNNHKHNDQGHRTNR